MYYDTPDNSIEKKESMTNKIQLIKLFGNSQA